MRNRLLMGIAAVSMVAGALVAAGASASASSTNAATLGNFAFGVARMDGQQEISPVTGQPGAGDLDGRGTFAFVAFDSKICYALSVRRIEPATMAHIHGAPRGVNGGIVVFLDTPTDGFSANCITAVPDTTANTPTVLTQSELNAIIANPAGFYANVHNDPFQAGAVRGQLR